MESTGQGRYAIRVRLRSFVSTGIGLGMRASTTTKELERHDDEQVANARCRELGKGDAEEYGDVIHYVVDTEDHDQMRHEPDYWYVGPEEHD